jgi:hypothetical protein
MNTSIKFLLEQVSEMNQTGDDGSYETPYAFSTAVEDPDDDVYTEPPPKGNVFYEKFDNLYQRIHNVTSLAEISYKDYKNDQNRSERQKINDNIKLINSKLREVEQMINHAGKLKMESGADQTVFWKGTLGNFQKIKERLNRLSNKIVEMNS